MAGAPVNIRTFIAPPKGPGKTAPAFIDDLTLHDPLRPPPSGINLLTSRGLDQVGVGYLGQLLPPGTCRHEFVTKNRQSLLPALDERPGSETVWQVSAVCRSCRIHVRLRVDYTIRWDDRPCPNVDNPVHHLVPSPWREQLARNEWISKNPQSQDLIYVFECSSRTCSASVQVQIAPPILSPNDVHTLVDEDLLKQRTDEAFKFKAGQVEGMRYPTTLDVLLDLRLYLRNARTKEPRPISIENKRFVVRFGPEGLACKEVLERLKFTYKPHVSWEAPVPTSEEAEPLEEPLNIFLDNAEHELGILISQIPSEGRPPTQDGSAGVHTQKDWARALSCQDYDKAPSSRAIRIDPSMRAAAYTALGIPEDASDHLVIFAYDQQVKTDPVQAPWYLSYLKRITDMRSSEKLQTKLAVEMSEGRFDAEQLNDAYKYFGLSLHAPPVEDDHIIGVFQSRLQDARMHEFEMREQLRLIGVHRGSKKIVQTAEDGEKIALETILSRTDQGVELNTYDQALAFLGADASMSDEFIVTMFTTKTVDDSSSNDKALKAVKMIADERKSQALHTWLDTGKMGDTTMDVGEAYAALQIDDRTADDEMILNAYQVYSSENPSNADSFSRALLAIAESKQSPLLLRFLKGQGITTRSGTSESPVGLENIGNTCYLNSLLQFFFTLPELRNIVLDFDRYKMDTAGAEMLKKKVGQRPVTIREVHTAQKFVASLAKLFQEMITSPESSITPEQELARLTLETEDAKEKIKRRSTIVSAGRPSLGHIDSMPIEGPLLPPSTVNEGLISEEAVQSPVEQTEASNPFLDDTEKQESTDLGEYTHVSLQDIEMRSNGDNSSEATLNGDDTPMTTDSETRSQQQHILDNKENLLPPKASDNTRRSQSPERKSVPLFDVSSSVLNSQAGVLATEPDALQEEGEKNNQTQYAPPPGKPPQKDVKVDPPSGKPPPIPPRPQQQQHISISKLEEYARQQDVTEVISHCLFQLSCAMRPIGRDKTGNQLDEIHDLFYGKVRYHFVPEQSTQNEDDTFSSIIARLYSKPRDIYEALDTYFDVEELENGSKRFSSISRPPPIFAVQLDRVEFDSRTKSYRKSDHHVDVKPVIYLDRYLEAAPESDQMERRRANWSMKQELSKMATRREELGSGPGGRDVPTIFEDARSVLESLQADFPDDEGDRIEPLPRTVETLAMLAETTRAELEDIDNRCRDVQTSMNSNFTDLRQHQYFLHAAFFHRGTQGSGHYWVYIFDFKQEIWRKYNDGYVTVIEDISEIFGKPSEDQYKGYVGPANPYFLVYVKAGEEKNLVECVHRNIVYPPPRPEPQPGPVMSQMTELPPGSMDYEMTEQGMSSEHPQLYRPDPQNPIEKKIGDWKSGDLADHLPHTVW